MFSWGPMLDYVALQMLFQVNWGELDYLVVDFPPGAADAQLEMLKYLKGAGALLTVGPQQVTHLDSRRLVQLLRERDVPVLGGVENMGSALCPDCGKEIELFPRDAAADTIWSLGVPELGRIPILPGLGTLNERSEPSVVADPDGPHAQAFRTIARSLGEQLK
jgi:ATP-binding protein involved in chromosome partitioning